MRRRFLVLFAVVACALLPASAALTAAAMPSTDVATTTPIKHMVMLMQDNHSLTTTSGPIREPMAFPRECVSV